MDPCVYLKSDLGEVFLLPEGQIVAGRNPDIAVTVDAAMVSWNHAAFHRRSAQAWVVDLGSANGTFVNRVQIGSEQWVALKEGDCVSFGHGPSLKVFWAPTNSNIRF